MSSADNDKGLAQDEGEEPVYRKWGDQLLPQKINPNTGGMEPDLKYPCIAPPKPDWLLAMERDREQNNGGDGGLAPGTTDPAQGNETALVTVSANEKGPAAQVNQDAMMEEGLNRVTAIVVDTPIAKSS